MITLPRTRIIVSRRDALAHDAAVIDWVLQVGVPADCMDELRECVADNTAAVDALAREDLEEWP